MAKEKEKKMAEEKTASLSWADAKKQLNKTYGVNSVGVGKDLDAMLLIPRLATGIFTVDLALGGGIPVGRTTQFFGEPSSCKSTLALRTVARAQKTCRHCYKTEHIDKKPGHEFSPMTCLWIELESTLDRKWAEINGVNVDLLDISHPGSAEEAINTFLMFLNSDGTDVVVIDSVAHMSVQEELANPAENMQVGAMARAMNKMFREQTALVNKKKKSGQMPTVLIINQIREKVGVMYGCASYRTRVVLSDGTTEKIGHFVGRRAEQEIMSLNRETGNIEPAKVSSWFRNGRAEEFLHFVTSAPNSSGKMSFDLTTNHLVAIERGGEFFDIPAGELKIGDNLISYASYKDAPYLNDALVGMMAGDGNLRRMGVHTAQYRMMHSKKQKSYLNWKADLLEPCLGANRHEDKRGRPEMETEADVRLGTLCQEVNGDRTEKFNPNWRGLQKSGGPLALALWYMDDGTFGGHYKRWGNGKSEFSAKSMTQDMQQDAANWVASLGIRRPTVDSRGHGLRFSGLQARDLHSVMAPYVPESMEYKLHPKLRGGQKWAPPNVVTEHTIHVPVKILSISKRRKFSDCSMQKYDLEVEDNHTYFVGGYPGVAVHNSPETRPGGKGQLFVNSLELRMRPGKDFFQGANGPIQKAAHDGDAPIFQEFYFTVKKTKIGTHKVEGSFKMQKVKTATKAVGEVDDQDQVFYHAKRLKLIEQAAKGKWIAVGLEETTEEKLLDKVIDSGKFEELRNLTIAKAIEN